MSVRIKELMSVIGSYTKTRNYKSFMIFVIISSFFWTLIKLSKEYTTQVVFTTNYISAPDNVVWDNSLHENIKISTTATGFQLIGYAFGSNMVDVDVSNLRSLGDDQYYIMPKRQLGSIIEQLPRNIKLVYQSPDTIFFDLSKRVDKKIPVILNDSLLLAPSFQFIDEIKIKPDSIVISGPSSFISKINNVQTKLYFKENIRSSINDKVLIDRIDNEKITMSDMNVNIRVGIEKFTQNRIEVPIVIENMPKGYLLKIFPNKASIIFNTRLSNYEDVSKSSFYVVADYNKLKDYNNQYIPIEVKLLSDKIHIVGVEPTEVEYLLRKIQ